MDKVTKIILASTLGLFLVLSTASCQLFADVGQDVVVTTTDNIKPESKDLVLHPGKDVLSKIPADVQAKLKQEGKEVVLAYPEDVIDATKGVTVTQPGQNGFANLLDLGMSIAGSIWPGAGAIGAAQFFFSRRARGHYVAAAQAVNPIDGGSVDVKEAVLSLGRAMGFAHSSEDTKAVFNGESVVVATQPATKV